MRLLVVDDDPKIRELMEAVLSYDADVTTVEDGRAAMRALARDRFDFVLLDVMMPGMSGFAVLEAIRADKGMGDLPVAMLTAMAGEFEHIQAFRAGADAYLTKPFDVSDLLGHIESLLVELPEERTARRRAELERAELFLNVERSFQDQ